MLRTKSGLVVAFVVLAAVAAVGMEVFKFPNRGDVGRNHDGTVHLSVAFTPTTVNQPVQVRVSVDGTPMLAEDPLISPWSKTIVAAPDAIISLRAFLPHGEKLDCFIARGGRPSAHEWREGPGGVHCLSHGK